MPTIDQTQVDGRSQCVDFEPMTRKNMKTNITIDIGCRGNLKVSTSQSSIRLARENQMITVSEMMARILASLEEAGSDCLHPLINTVLDPTGAPEEVKIFQKALEELLRSNLILVFMTSMDAPRDLLDRSGELQALADLPTYYKYLADKKLWHDIRCGGPPYFQTPQPEAELTDAGMERAVELLEDPGFEWWRPGRSA